jgi:hypothetical protein
MIDVPIALLLVCCGYLLAGLAISFACWRDDPTAGQWRASDWVAAVAASPVVVLVFWIESLRQR